MVTTNAINTSTGAAATVLTGQGVGITPIWAAPAISSVVVQKVSKSSSALFQATTVIPFDDTIPEKTEGDEFLTLDITPTNANNILEISFNIFGTNGTNKTTAALFQDATTNALAATMIISASVDNATLFFRMTAGTTSATTFKIRIGPSAAATVDINGFSGARLYGGVGYSYLTITEYKV